MREERLLPSEQPPLPYHLCNDHVDDRRLAAPVGFEAALQRILDVAELDLQDLGWLLQYFRTQVRPVLTP